MLSLPRSESCLLALGRRSENITIRPCGIATYGKKRHRAPTEVASKLFDEILAEHVSDRDNVPAEKQRKKVRFSVPTEADIWIEERCKARVRMMHDEEDETSREHFDTDEYVAYVMHSRTKEFCYRRCSAFRLACKTCDIGVLTLCAPFHANFEQRNETGISILPRRFIRDRLLLQKWKARHAVKTIVRCILRALIHGRSLISQCGLPLRVPPLRCCTSKC